MTMYYVALVCVVVGAVAIFIKRAIIKYLGIALLIAAVILAGCNWYINDEKVQLDVIIPATQPPVVTQSKIETPISSVEPEIPAVESRVPKEVLPPAIEKPEAQHAEVSVESIG